MITIPMTVSATTAEIDIGISPSLVPIAMTVNATQSDAGKYTGEYVVTPSDEQQTLETAGKILKQNVVIEPIPQNYGLITWSGLGIRVS